MIHVFKLLTLVLKGDIFIFVKDITDVGMEIDYPSLFHLICFPLSLSTRFYMLTIKTTIAIL